MDTTNWLADTAQIPVQELPGFAPDGSNTCVSMLRLDTIHPFISGNKWFKLKYNIETALAEGYTSLITFGGAYSNHLIAAAAAAQHYRLYITGMVRGEEARRQLNPVLQQCRDMGMRLEFVPRDVYRSILSDGYRNAVLDPYHDHLLIPEGGANEAGRKGAGEIAGHILPRYTHICVSVGSGTTLAGLRQTLSPSVHIAGFAPLKGGSYMKTVIAGALERNKDVNWSLTDDYHFGGFGKTNEQLQGFMQSFHSRYGFMLDRVYTAKMMWGVKDLLECSKWPEGADILCIHTGGLTGN